jgi:hypothetical protein
MNTVSLVGRISERGVRLDYTPERAKPQLNFSLTVMEMGRDGIARPTYIPCMVVSDNAERLAEVLEPQPSSRHPLLWWGMNSTLCGKYLLDQRPEPHGTSSRALNV